MQIKFGDNIEEYKIKDEGIKEVEIKRKITVIDIIPYYDVKYFYKYKNFEFKLNLTKKKTQYVVSVTYGPDGLFRQTIDTWCGSSLSEAKIKFMEKINKAKNGFYAEKTKYIDEWRNNSFAYVN